MLKIFQFEGNNHFLCLKDGRTWGLLKDDDFSSFEKKGGFSDALKPWAYTIAVSWMPQKLMHGFRAAFDIPKYMLRR